jgi:eukaryotic-like serine/threonine-protein kinase
MRGRLNNSIWIVPLAIAGIVALFGWWGNGRLRDTIESQLRAELTTALGANVTALDIWTTNQAKLATTLADEPKLRELAIRIFDRFYEAGGDNQKLLELPEAQELETYLRPRLGRIGYGLANLVSTNLFVVASPMRGGRMRPSSAITEDHVAKFSELFASGQPVIITPFKPKRPEPPPGGRRGMGQGEPGSRSDRFRSSRPRGSNDFGFGNRPPPPEFGPGRRGDITLMQVAAPVRDDKGVVRGALALIINPDTEFTRILSVARSGKTGETYAFDEQGLMISRSRFDDQLKTLALIENRPGASSALNLRLTDPGGDMTTGFKPPQTESSARTLTHIVANAVAGGSGVDLEPLRDYRGVPVVGAWQWLPQHGFGVATQMDAREAYQSLRVLKLLFVLLFLLLVLCATGMFLFSYLNFVWRRRLSEAELKVKQLGQYALEEKIGEGGMGVVYRARHALMRRETAVKLLLPDRADPASIERFEREVCLTCQLTHPNTIQVYDYGHTPEGIFYYAMEYLRGFNLHELVARFGAVPEGRAIHILTQVCESLAEAHALGLVHRDIKPANVFLCERGNVPDCVKVLDFGLVREYRGGKRDEMHLTGEKGMVGTPSFMPPESMKNSSRSDPRSDIYSVGALGYFLLTGQYVFNSDSVLELYEMHLTQIPTPPSQRSKNPVSSELELALLRCLEKEPNLRPQSVAELRSLLLTSPRACEWGLEERRAWWAKHQTQLTAPSSETNGSKSEPIAATVKIDFASRIS